MDEAASGAVPEDVRRRRAAARERTRRRRSHRRRAVLGAIILLSAIAAAAALSRPGRRLAPTPPRSTPLATHSRPAPAPPHAPSPGSVPATRFAVGLRVLRLTDSTRTVVAPRGGRQPRRLLTYVRYPVLGRPSGRDLPGAPAALAGGPFPLIVFGHGFALTPAFYAPLLRSWASAGYVVAAPAFPLENAYAPGGPDEADLVNQPADLRFLISRMLGLSATGGPFGGLVDPTRIALAGHSDGGDTALAVAYGRAARDRRVGAAIVLAGARLPGGGGFSFRHGSPPLFAAQGTADTVNPPSLTDGFYALASPPKFRLRLLGAAHLPPYTHQEPQLAVVEATTTAFLDYYLKREPPALKRLFTGGSVRGVASLDGHL